jgi:Thiamine pyrophosphate enzyme, central domain
VTTVGDLVRRGLSAIGVEAVYGRPLRGVPVVAVGDDAVARLLAEAHLLVHRTRCAIHCGGLLVVVDRGARFPVVDPPRVDVTDADALVEAWRTADTHLRSDPGAVTIAVGVEPARDVDDREPAPPEAVDRWVEPPDEAVALLAPARSPVALVGPGVAEPAHVPGLHALAAAGNLGVLNTWGAKGVFHWRSRHHWATVGLQARDFELGGLATADLVVTAGLDEREAPEPTWRTAGTAPTTGPGPVTAIAAVTVAPGALGPLAERWSRPRVELEVPPLRAGLATVTQEGWTQDAAPLVPSRVTLAYGSVVGSRGLVAADPGTAGYWVARTFATASLGGAVVPARAGASGLAAACVAVARLRSPGRPALAVIDGPDLDPATARVVEVAERLGVPVPVECWDPGAPHLDAAAHVARLRRALAAERATTLPLATDPTQLDRMVDVAGPVIAWR